MCLLLNYVKLGIYLMCISDYIYDWFQNGFWSGINQHITRKNHGSWPSAAATIFSSHSNLVHDDPITGALRAAPCPWVRLECRFGWQRQRFSPGFFHENFMGPAQVDSKATSAGYDQKEKHIENIWKMFENSHRFLHNWHNDPLHERTFMSMFGIFTNIHQPISQKCFFPNPALFYVPLPIFQHLPSSKTQAGHGQSNRRSAKKRPH